MRISSALALAGLVLTAAAAPMASAAEPPSVQAAAPAWLGVSMDAGGPDGVLVRHVVRSSPAEKAGLKVGDRIVRLEGREVTRATEVTRIVANRGAGDVMPIGFVRGGKEVTVRATLEARPDPDDVLRMDHVGAFAPAWANVTPVAAAPKSLGELRGRVVLLDFWATWCGPCRAAAPRLSALQSRYGAQGLTVVGMTTDGADVAAAFAQRTSMRYGVVVDDKGDTSRAYGVSGLPTMFVIDKRGVVREVEVGFSPQGDGGLEELLKQLLAEPAPSP